MRKTIKRSLSVLLACLMIMSIASVALADGTAAIAVGTATGEAGDSVAVDVTLTGSGITNGVFKVTYDTSTLTYASASSLVNAEVAEISAGTLSIAFAKTTAVSGTIATLNFTIAAGASAGTVAITPSFAAADAAHYLDADALYVDDTPIEAASVTLTAGSVTVEDNTPAFTRGDVNGDGQVNSADAIYLLNYTFSAASYPLVGDSNGDMNGDEQVNSADAIYLLNYTFSPSSYPLA